MQRILSTLLLVSLLFAVGCKKESEPTEKSTSTETTKEDTLATEKPTPSVKKEVTSYVATDYASLLSGLEDMQAGDTLWIDSLITLEKALLIEKRDSLFIKGKRPGVGFEIPSIEEDVIAIKNSSYITIQNIHASHSVKTRCFAPVIGVYESAKIFIDGCNLNGCGEVGVTAENCTGEIYISHNEIHNCSHEGVAVEKSSVRATNNNFYNNGKGSNNSQGFTPETAHIALRDSQSSLKLNGNQFDRKTKLVKDGHGTFRNPDYFFHSDSSAEDMVRNYHSLYESTYANFKKIRGNGFLSDDGTEWDIPITYKMPVRRSGKTYEGKLFYTDDLIAGNGESTAVDTVYYGDEGSRLSMIMYRVGLVKEFATGDAGAYVLEVAYGSKDGEGGTEFINVVKDQSTLYIDRGALDEYTFKLMLPPYGHTENPGGPGESWTGLEHFKLFGGVNRVELCKLTMFPKKLGKEFTINDTKLILQGVYHGSPSKIDNTTDTYAGFPIYVKTDRLHMQDSTSPLLYTRRGDTLSNTQGYHVAYPDGTVGIYGFPPIDGKMIYRADGTRDSYSADKYFADRSHLSLYGDDHGNWSGQGPTVMFVNDTLFPDSAMQYIGSNGKKKYDPQDSLFVLKDPKHWLHRKFYRKLKHDQRSKYPDHDTDPLAHPKQFYESYPYLFRRDPLGNMVCYLKHQYIPQLMAEPIIYLYSDSTLKVHIEIDSSVTITNAIPKLTKTKTGNSWSVEVTDSLITDLSNKTKHSRLFWEGQSVVFPPIDTGFLVRVDKLEPLLDSLLKQQGLNKRERSDFITAWKPEMSVKSWVAFRFFDQTTIDRLAPLRVSPKPETTIRVMMGYRPLDKGVVYVPKQTIPQRPKRTGFTLVEWGGVAL